MLCTRFAMIRQMRPVAATERVVSIDVLRGVALLGVLLVNLLAGFRVPLAGHILGLDEPLGPGGSFLLSLVSAVIEFKAFTLFSFLFGVGVAIQAGRTAAAKSTRFLLRRFGALMAFGLIHLLFVWNGDILTLYALCGLILIPLLRFPPAALAGLGALLIAAPIVAPLPVPFPDDAVLRQLAAEALHAYRTSRWHELFAFRWRETQLLVVPLLLLSLTRTLGLMLLGIAAWRAGLFDGRRGMWRWILIAGAAIGLASLVVRNEQIATISLAFAYGAGILVWNPHAPLLAAGGRMAFTNYLFQSIFFGFAFYGYGLGWFGRLGVGITLAGGVVFYCAQLVWSRWWLRRFYFGPLEWLWRSISYLEWQPFLRAEWRTLSRNTIRTLALATFLFVMPAVHLGGPLLLARPGPQWGWHNGYPGAVNLLGTIPIAAGLALLGWVLLTMLRAARNWPPRVRVGLQPVALLQCGPYALMRHPIYAGEGCLWIGSIILLGSPVVLIVFACLAVTGYTYILPREELALQRQFGEEYRSYCTRVPRLWQFRRRT